MSEAIEAQQQEQPQRRIFLFGESEQENGAPTDKPVTRERWDRVRAALEGKPYEVTPELVSDLLLEFAAQERFRRMMMTACMQTQANLQELAAASTIAHVATFRAADAFASGRVMGKYEAFAHSASLLANAINKVQVEGARR